MDLRFLGKVLQGALIGLGAVLPGISGGVLSVVFGVYRPIMELLSDPVHKWRTHLPELFPYMIGSAAGFLGVANLLSYVLETYPEQSVCVFVGLIGGMLPSLWREAGEQGRTGGNRIVSGVTFAAMIFLLFSLVSSNIFKVTFSSVFMLFFGIFSPANISLIDTVNISLSFINTEESGIVIPRSHLLTACLLIGIMSAN